MMDTKFYAKKVLGYSQRQEYIAMKLVGREDVKHWVM